MQKIEQIENEAFREYFGRMNKRQLLVILAVFVSFVFMASGFVMLIMSKGV